MYGRDDSANSTLSTTATSNSRANRGSEDTTAYPEAKTHSVLEGESVDQGQGAATNVTSSVIEEFAKAAAGDFVAKNKLQAGLGRSGLHSALKSALGTLQKGKIPLLLAVEAGNQSMCRELLGQQAAEQLKATTDNGDAAIHLAARRRDVDMIRILVDYGTNVDLQNVSIDWNVHVCMALACKGLF
jgi:hypothetical protein